jgi:hypothetical protein
MRRHGRPPLHRVPGAERQWCLHALIPIRRVTIYAPSSARTAKERWCISSRHLGRGRSLRGSLARCCPVPRGRASAAGESGRSIRSPTAGHPPKLAVAGYRSHSGRAFVQRLRVGVLSSAGVGAARQGARREVVERPRPAIGKFGRVELEIACWSVCRSRRWCPIGSFFRVSVLSRGP